MNILNEHTSSSLLEPDGTEEFLRLQATIVRGTAPVVLKRGLATGTVHSTNFTFAQRIDTIRFIVSDLLLRDIGRGSCGSIFEQPGADAAYVVKKGSDTTSIRRDYDLTMLAYTSCATLAATLKSLRIPVVPMAHEYIPLDATSENIRVDMSRFTEEDRNEEGAMFKLDCILPVTEITRFSLVNNFFLSDSDTQRAILDEIDNKDCLVRLYFGENKDDMMYTREDTLRNFPLYLNQAKELELDIDGYAKEMATGLAILHWQAQSDAGDTELVIGNAAGDQTRETRLWMLDFDKCTHIMGNLGNENFAAEEEDFDPFDRTEDGENEEEDDREEESDSDEDEDITDDEEITLEDDSEDSEQD